MVQPLNQLSEAHLDRIRRFFDEEPGPTAAARAYRRWLARYLRLMIPPGARVLEIGCGVGDLLGDLPGIEMTGVDLSEVQVARAGQRFPRGRFHVQAGEHLDLPGEKFDVVIVSDTINYAADAQAMLERIHSVSTPDTRLILNFQSNLWRPMLRFARMTGISRPTPDSSWLAAKDVVNLLQLSGWEVIRHDHRLLLPVSMAGLDRLLNRFLAPLIPWLCLTDFVVARPTPVASAMQTSKSVSVVIPARNESGNIEAAVMRTPDMGAWTELIFVEGHSRDDTWAEIERVKAAYPSRRIKTLRQTGSGKGNAVREGFAIAEGDILMILDADLTMPPEELPKFYAVLASGRAEFANGVRLVYPMEERAMQFLNLCANKAFGLMFSWLLGQPLKDTLCGTKVLSRANYEKIAANRAYFGDFDPFGDFDLLFGAGRLNLKIADVPIRYRERTYGSTNIQRWRHGWLLLRMVEFAARKLKFV